MPGGDVRQRSPDVSDETLHADFSENQEQSMSRFGSFYGIILQIILALIIIKYALTKSIKPLPLILPKLIEMIGPLKINSRLSHAERRWDFVGAESILIIKGKLYASLLDGTIVTIDNDGSFSFIKLGGGTCRTIISCGRPLGLHFDEVKNRILVADAYLGLFEIDIKTMEYKKIFPFPGDTSFNVVLFNSVTTLSDGRIVLTQSSQKFPLHLLLADVFEADPSGRVLLINPLEQTWKVLADRVYFANGVQLHRDNKSVLVAETILGRILRIPLDGGGAQEFALLPGMPDNIRSSPRGGYWVGVVVPRYQDKPSILDYLASWPFMRRMLYGMLPYSLIQWISNLHKHAMVVRLGDDGGIIESLHDITGNMYGVAEAYEYEGALYLGSYYAPFIGKLIL